jgi:hypothetical protein
MADLEISRSTPLHPGVDAKSWLGFEQKIQARRFEALLASAKDALATGNAVLAQHAIEEAREIRPESPALHELEAGVRRLVPAEQGAALWRRAAGGVMLLAAGVLMFVVVDETRIPPGTLPVVAPPPPQVLRVAPAAGRFERNAIFADAIEAGEGASTEERVPESADAPAIVAPPSLRRATPAAPATPTPTTRADDGNTAAVDRIDVSNRLDVPSHSGPQDRVELARPILRPDIVPAAPVLPAASSVPAVINAVHVDRSADETLRVADVLRRYARAYGDLDVRAAREVWPDVDQRALARAFDGLASQTVSFDDCQIDVQGATANASCHGQTSYVGKVGRGSTRTEPRTWRFHLRRDGETWKIANAEARRTSG